jgi:hypothetical protein
MNEYDNIIDELIKRMNNNNISKDKQIDYLKNYIKLFENEYDNNLRSLTIGTFISSFGIGVLAFPQNEIEISIGVLFILIGISISLINKNNSCDNNKEYDDINNLKQEIEEELKEKKIYIKK